MDTRVNRGHRILKLKNYAPERCSCPEMEGEGVGYDGAATLNTDQNTFYIKIMVALKMKNKTKLVRHGNIMGQKNILIFMFLLATAHGHIYFNRSRLRFRSHLDKITSAQRFSLHQYVFLMQ